MGQLKIARDRVIQALRTEPLRPGRFFHINNDTSAQDCQVCAVGAVLRQHASAALLARFDNYGDLHTTRITQTFCKGSAVCSDPGELIKQKNYMGALSSYFEKIMRAKKQEHVTGQVIDLLIKFVKKNFPAQFTVRY